MPLSSQALKVAIESYDGEDDLASYVVNLLESVKDIEDKIKRNRLELAKEQESWKTAKKRFDNNLKIYQEQCEHLDTTYNGDPSGNGDSYIECRICGKKI